MPRGEQFHFISLFSDFISFQQWAEQEINGHEGAKLGNDVATIK